MTTYFVRRCYGLNGATYPEIWYETAEVPTASTECGKSIRACHEVTQKDLELFEAVRDAQGNGFDRGSDGLRLIDFLSSLYPENA